MDGRIRSADRCACGGRFEVVMAAGVKCQTDLVCGCGARPRYVYIDARPWAAKLYNDPRTGRKWDSFGYALRYLQRMNDEKEAHTFDRTRYVPAKMREMTVETEAANWLSSIDRVKYRSRYDSSANAVRLFLPSIGRMDVRDVRRGHLVAMRDRWLAMGREPSSVKTYLGRVVAFLRWLEEREIVPSVPKMPRIEIPYKKRPWINREGQERILSFIASRHRLMFELLVETGMRMGEVCGLLVRDVEDGEVIIERALDSAGNEKGVKTSKDGEVIVRYLSVSRDLYARLEAHARGRFGAETLFKNRFGNSYRSRGLWAIWREASIKAGLPISPREGTRHSRASQMRRRREEEMAAEISGQLGNTPAISMKHYMRPRNEEMT